ncbi:hypothetical protein STEG23_029105, partial [Scotinomys teguina]
IIGIAGKPENAFANKKAEQLQDLIFPMASKACPSLKSLDTQIICIRESNPVVLRGYGFDFAMHKEEVICRFYFSDIDMSFKDAKAFNLTNITVTCPGPVVEEPGDLSLSSFEIPKVYLMVTETLGEDDNNEYWKSLAESKGLYNNKGVMRTQCSWKNPESRFTSLSESSQRALERTRKWVSSGLQLHSTDWLPYYT